MIIVISIILLTLALFLISQITSRYEEDARFIKLLLGLFIFGFIIFSAYPNITIDTQKKCYSTHVKSQPVKECVYQKTYLTGETINFRIKLTKK